MMYCKDLVSLRSEIATLKQILASLPTCRLLERIGFESKLVLVQEELLALQKRVRKCK